jgi:hypothetical protein
VLDKRNICPNYYGNELDLLECLEAAPEIEENGVYYSYKVLQERISLLFTVWQFESVVQISLSDTISELPVTRFALFVRGGIHRRKFKNLELLVIQDCFVIPDRFYSIELDDILEKKVWPTGLTVELSIKPQIQIQFVPSSES